MNLLSTFTTNADEAMDKYISNLNDVNDFDEETEYEDFCQEFVNSYTKWWDFPETDLTIANINELLVAWNECQTEHDITKYADSVTQLLEMYGFYMMTEEQDFRVMWSSKWNNPSNQ